MVLIPKPKRGKPKSQKLVEVFCVSAPKDAVGEVYYGVDEWNIDDWYQCLALGKPWYAIDNSYFDGNRGNVDDERARFRITRNALQVPVAKQPKSDGERFKMLNIDLKPWQFNPKGHFVFAEQSPDFMRQVARDPQWLHKKYVSLVKSGEKVIFRRWSANKLKQESSLPKDLEGAACLVTYSSAAAVTALIHGVRTVVGPGSALYGVTTHQGVSRFIGMIDNRFEILSVLADNEFSFDEIRSGEAWEILDGSRRRGAPGTET